MKKPLAFVITLFLLLAAMPTGIFVFSSSAQTAVAAVSSSIDILHLYGTGGIGNLSVTKQSDGSYYMQTAVPGSPGSGSGYVGFNLSADLRANNRYVVFEFEEGTAALHLWSRWTSDYAWHPALYSHVQPANYCGKFFVLDLTKLPEPAPNDTLNLLL